MGFDTVARFLQLQSAQIGQGLFIIHKQNAPFLLSWHGLLIRGALDRDCRACGQGQIDPKIGALSRRGVHLDASLMALENAVDHR